MLAAATVGLFSSALGGESLVVQDPDGYTYELDRFHLSRGTHVLPPGPYRYTDWDARLRLYVEASGARAYDVAETYFYVR